MPKNNCLKTLWIAAFLLSLNLNAEHRVQWALHSDGSNGTTNDIDINMPEAWAISPGSDDILVFTLGTGANSKLAALRDTFWENPLEIADNGFDDDENGYVDDINGVNVIQHNGNIDDDNGFGTMQASVLRSDESIIGTPIAVMKRGKVVACKCLDSDGTGFMSDVGACLSYAENLVANKDKYGFKRMVIQYPIGGGTRSQATYDQLAHLKFHDVVVVASAGSNAENLDNHDDSHVVKYGLPNIIAGVGVLKNGERAPYSNFGKNSLTFGVPMGNILALQNNGNLASFSGSLSSALAAGVVALMLGVNPELTVEDINLGLRQCGLPLDALRDKCTSERLMKADCLLDFAQSRI